MGQAIPNQHPAVVLRSHFNTLRALLAVALIAVVGLTVAVVVLATDDEQVTSTAPAATIGELKYGGFNPAAGRPEALDATRSQAQSGPSESRIAEAIGTAEAPTTTGGPDESRIAAALASDPDASTAVDESVVAHSVAGR